MEFISHCIKDKKGRLGNRAMLGALCVLAAFGLLGWIFLLQASQVAITSRHVQELETEKRRLQEQNLQLMAEIAQLESVSQLAKRAQEIGFVNVTVQDIQFLAVAEPQNPSEMTADASQPDGWWADVAAQFAAWSQTGSP